MRSASGVAPLDRVRDRRAAAAGLDQRAQPLGRDAGRGDPHRHRARRSGRRRPARRARRPCRAGRACRSGCATRTSSGAELDALRGRGVSAIDVVAHDARPARNSQPGVTWSPLPPSSAGMSVGTCVPLRVARRRRACRLASAPSPARRRAGPSRAGAAGRSAPAPSPPQCRSRRHRSLLRVVSLRILSGRARAPSQRRRRGGASGGRSDSISGRARHARARRRRSARTLGQARRRRASQDARRARPRCNGRSRLDTEHAHERTHRPHRPQDPPADRLGERRLRRHRHDLADRRRVARRSLRPAHRRARARRRRRQRQRDARRGAPRLPGRRRPTTSARCSSAAPSAPPPSACDVEFQEADAEALPFDDASFDAVLSTFGVMFAPDHAKSAAEMLRVCRPGGRIGLANWTPEGFIGQLFKTLGRHVPPPPGVQSPSLWGIAVAPARRCSATARASSIATRTFNFRYRSAAHFIDVFRTWYGPVHKAFAALPAEQGAALERDLTELLDRLNRAGPRIARRAERVPRGRRDPALTWKRGCSGASSATAGTSRRTTTSASGRRSSAPAQADMLARVGLRAGERVLDVACGTGLVSFAAAAAVGAARPGARRRHFRRDGRRGATPCRCARRRPRRASRAWTPRRSTSPTPTSTSRCAPSA